MPEVDHDWDKIIPCNNKYKVIDKVILTFITLTLAFASGALLLAIINNPTFC